MDSDNAIIQQSDRHPDGWGVAYYHMGSPHLVKNESQARKCKIFEKVSGVVSSNTVVTHIRKSTIGEVGPLNTHPFQYGPWVFVHNGNVENFSDHKAQLLARIDDDLKRYILGSTDSEHLFYLLLAILRRQNALDPGVGGVQIQNVLSEFVQIFKETCGPLTKSQGDYDKNYLTFLVTNGRSMFALNGGQPLFYSTHKGRCSERDHCSFFNPICETKANNSDKIHHLLISSEVIENENEWSPLGYGDFVGVDRDFVFHLGHIDL